MLDMTFCHNLSSIFFSTVQLIIVANRPFIKVGFENWNEQQYFAFHLKDDDSVEFNRLQVIFPGIVGLKYRDSRTNYWNIFFAGGGYIKPQPGEHWIPDILYVPAYPT
ncbi:unnamed protein product, partial [Rotaria socialis]